MNPTLQTILSRRSIRNYQPQQISDEQLEAILQAGLFAPSAMNEQAWKLAVVQNPKTLGQLADAMAVTGRDSNPFYNAPTLIVVFVKKDAIAPFSDGALCLGNMMNAAAQKFRCDPLELRLKNILPPDAISKIGNFPLGDVRLEDVLRLGSKRFRWFERRGRKTALCMFADGFSKRRIKRRFFFFLHLNNS